jgi:predicted Rossmann fold flavoprotein
MGDLPPISDVVVVGAGAAGLATAIFARRANRARGVVLLDGARKPGAKILISGGSRCNVTNTHVGERDFWGGLSAPRRGKIVGRILRAFPPERTVELFRDLGVPLHVEEDGKLFPDSNRSRDILDALLREVSAVGALLVAGCRVLDVEAAAGGFRIATTTGEMSARRVVLATGGRSLPKTGSDGAGLDMARRLGHTIVQTTPALTPLLLADGDSIHRELAGVAQRVELSVWIDGAVAERLKGSMLWTHFGVSGPAALNCSRHYLRAVLDQRPVSITANFCDGAPFDDVDRSLVELTGGRPRASMQTALSAFVPASVAHALLRQLAIAGGTPLSQLSRDDRRRLAHALTSWRLPVTGARGYDHAEVTAGGVALTEIDPATMASRVCPGLYLVGEMLDVDGRLGGFNFQWAWATGRVAGTALARD